MRCQHRGSAPGGCNDGVAPALVKKRQTSDSPSPTARALAAGMRDFDSRLGDAELLQIARLIDEQRAASGKLNPRRARLRNAEEPVSRFGVEDHLQ